MKYEFFDIFLDESIIIDIPVLICPEIKTAFEIEAEKEFDDEISNIMGTEEKW